MSHVVTCRVCGGPVHPAYANLGPLSQCESCYADAQAGINAPRPDRSRSASRVSGRAFEKRSKR
jgi:hypothetical protein